MHVISQRLKSGTASLVAILSMVSQVFFASGIRGCWLVFWWLFVVQTWRYRKWVERYALMTPADRDSIRHAIEALPGRPRISVLMPVYAPDISILRAAIESVRGQLYSDWELCIADDCSPAAEVRLYLEDVARQEPRLRLLCRERNGHISAATNSALELATGEFFALLDQDDLISADALHHVAHVLANHPEAELIYSDEDKIDGRGQRFGPYFKPDWNWGQMLSHNMVSHLGIYRTSLVRSIGGFRLGLEGSQDYDLALRVSEVTQPQRIHHIPHVLYHWRTSNRSTAMNPHSKAYAFRAGRRAIQEHIDRLGSAGTVESSWWPGLYRIDWQPPDPAPSVTVVVWGDKPRDIRRFSQLTGTEIPVDWRWIQQSTQPSPERCRDFRRQLAQEMADSRSDFVALLHASLLPNHPLWLKRWLATAAQPGIGVVGAKLLHRRRVVHAGYVLDSSGNPHEIGKGFLDGVCLPHLYGWLASLRDCAAVSGRALLARREVMEAVAWNESPAQNHSWELEIAAVARSRGWRVWWTPEVVFHTNSQAACLIDPPTCSQEALSELSLSQWKPSAYYSDHLSWDRGGFDFASPPRGATRWPRHNPTSETR